MIKISLLGSIWGGLYEQIRKGKESFEEANVGGVYDRILGYFGIGRAEIPEKIEFVKKLFFIIKDIHDTNLSLSQIAMRNEISKAGVEQIFKYLRIFDKELSMRKRLDVVLDLEKDSEEEESYKYALSEADTRKNSIPRDQFLTAIKPVQISNINLGGVGIADDFDTRIIEIIGGVERELATSVLDLIKLLNKLKDDKIPDIKERFFHFIRVEGNGLEELFSEFVSYNVNLVRANTIRINLLRDYNRRDVRLHFFKKPRYLITADDNPSWFFLLSAMIDRTFHPGEIFFWLGINPLVIHCLKKIENNEKLKRKVEIEDFLYDSILIHEISHFFTYFWHTSNRILEIITELFVYKVTMKNINELGADKLSRLFKYDYYLPKLFIKRYPFRKLLYFNVFSAYYFSGTRVLISLFGIKEDNFKVNNNEIVVYKDKLLQKFCLDYKQLGSYTVSLVREAERNQLRDEQRVLIEEIIKYKLNKKIKILHRITSENFGGIAEFVEKKFLNYDIIRDEMLNLIESIDSDQNDLTLNYVERELRFHPLIFDYFLTEDTIKGLNQKRLDGFYLHGLVFLHIVIEYFIVNDFSKRKLFIDYFKKKFYNKNKYRRFHFYNVLKKIKRKGGLG